MLRFYLIVVPEVSIKGAVSIGIMQNLSQSEKLIILDILFTFVFDLALNPLLEGECFHFQAPKKPLPGIGVKPFPLNAGEVEGAEGHYLLVPSDHMDTAPFQPL